MAWAEVLCLLVAAAALFAAPAAGRNLVLNGDFEADSDGDGMSDHWTYSGDETVEATWRREQRAEGGHAQQLSCTSFTGHGPASHVMLAQYDSFSLKKGQWYRLSLEARGEIPGRVVSIAVRETEPWRDTGLHDVFRITPEWHSYEFIFRARRDITRNIRLQIWYQDTGTLWVDNVRLAEVAGAESWRPQRYTEAIPDIASKNLLPNSSFECGASGWGSVGLLWSWAGDFNSIFGRVDDATSAVHSQSFRIDLDRASPPTLAFDYFDARRTPVLAPLLASRGWVSVVPGEEYTLSAYLKSDPRGTPCAAIIYQAFGDSIRHDLEAPGEWERASFTFRPQSDQIFVAIGPDLRHSDLGKATLWVDGVQLEKGGKATEYELRSPVEIGLEWEKPGHLFESARQAAAALTAFNGSAASQRVQVAAAVTDFFDRPAAAPRVELTLAPGEPVRAELPLGVTEKGFYRFSLSAEGGAVVPVAAERFGVVDFCTDADGIWGMNHAYPWPGLLHLSKEFGLTWFRDWSLKWETVEPEQGKFDYAETDHQVDRVREHGLNVLGLLPFPSAEWSSAAPADVEPNPSMGERTRLAHKPRDLGEFADYVRATVGRYADRIRVWEVFNEPLYTGYALPQQAGHTIEDYVVLLKTAYQAIKEADPQAFVIGGIAADPETLTAELIAAGGLDWMDAINIHIYPVLRAPERYLDGLDKLNQMMARAGKVKPIYFTEGGYYGDDDPATDPYRAGDALLKPLDSEVECASYLVRFSLILLSRNVKMIIWHSGTPGALNRDSLHGIFFEWDGAPRKMTVAQSVLANLLGPDTEYLGSVWEEVRSFAFHSRGKTAVGVWDEREGGRSLHPRGGGRLLDLAGAPPAEGPVTIGGTPHYIVLEGTLDLGEMRDAIGDWLR